MREEVPKRSVNARQLRSYGAEQLIGAFGRMAEAGAFDEDPPEDLLGVFGVWGRSRCACRPGCGATAGGEERPRRYGHGSEDVEGARGEEVWFGLAEGIRAAESRHRPRKQRRYAVISFQGSGLQAQRPEPV
jgi:hypothetical protein